MSSTRRIVQKYGGTSVGTPERIRAVAARVKRAHDAGHETAVVVSAMAGETNRLFDLAEQVSSEPHERELDVLQGRTDFTDTSSVDSYFHQARELAIVKTAELFSNSGAELRLFLDALREMTPPDVFVDVHQDAVAAGEALAASMPLTIEAVRSLAALEDLDETLVEAPYSVAAQRFAIACQNLEDAAIAESLDVDLTCPTGPAVIATG